MTCRHEWNCFDMQIEGGIRKYYMKCIKCDREKITTQKISQKPCVIPYSEIAVERNCIVCDTPFLPISDSHILCSDECRLVYQRIRSRKYTKLSLRWKIMLRDGFKCKYCGRSSNDDVVLHVDHILARSHGGTDDLDNLITSCKECNFGKSATLLEEHEIEKIHKLFFKDMEL